MRLVSDNYKTAITFPRQITAKIYVDNTEIEESNINNINYSFNSDLFKTIMQVVKIDTDIAIQQNKTINPHFGLKVNGEYEYVDFGNFKVYTTENNKDTNSYQITCYDKMIESMIDYNLEIPSGTTIRDVWIMIFNALEWDTSTIPTSFINSTKTIETDPWVGYDLTFRDVLDELCTISLIWLADRNGTITFIKHNESSKVTIDEHYFDQNNVVLGEKIFFTHLIFSRSNGLDNIYRSDELLSKIAHKELKLVDYRILSDNNREQFIDEMARSLWEWTYYECDVQTVGITFLESADRYHLSFNGNLYPTLLMNNEININTGLSENISADKPMESQTEIKYASTSDKNQKTANLIVDKKLAQISAEVKDKVGNDEVIASLNLAIEDGKGVVRFKSDQFEVDSTNLQIDKYGNVTAENLNLNGGQLLLKDDGTKENASIKIISEKEIYDDIVVGTEIKEFTKLKLKLKGLTFDELINESTILYTNLNKEIIINCFEDATGRYLQIPELGVIETFENNILTKDLEIDITEDLGIVTKISSFGIDYFKIIIDKITNEISYSSNGLEADIIAPFNFTQEDVDYLRNLDRDLETGEILGLTSEQIKFYDMNGDGIVTSADILTIDEIIFGYDEYNIYPTKPGKIKIRTIGDANDFFVPTNQSQFKHIIIEDGDGNEKVVIGNKGVMIDGFLYSKENIQNIMYGNTNVLWEADNDVLGYHMNSDQSITLNEKISEQRNGIVLVWYGYNTDTKKRINGVTSYQFIPKWQIKSGNNSFFLQQMSFINFSKIGTKALSFTDNTINGDSRNINSGTANGITYDNSAFILSYVLGV